MSPFFLVASFGPKVRTFLTGVAIELGHQEGSQRKESIVVQETGAC